MSHRASGGHRHLSREWAITTRLALYFSSLFYSPSAVAHAHFSPPVSVASRDDPSLALSTRGGTGLFDSELAAASEPMTLRLRWSTDFFSRSGFFCCANTSANTDRHSRFRMATALDLSVTRWLELWTAVRAASNRNVREQANRQDPPNVFALGDTDLGIKLILSPRQRWIALALLQQTTLLSGGSSRLGAVRASFDALATWDFRDRSRGAIPLRLTLNSGWIYDDSPSLAKWSAITDPFSREVFRFALGTNVSRWRNRLALDVPLAVGRQRQWQVAAIFEYAWDIATASDPHFRQPPSTQVGAARGITLPRSQAWANLGGRVTLRRRLFADAAAQVAVLQPGLPYGARLAPWQMMVGIGTLVNLQRARPQVAKASVATPKKKPLSPPPVETRQVSPPPISTPLPPPLVDPTAPEVALPADKTPVGPSEQEPNATEASPIPAAIEPEPHESPL